MNNIEFGADRALEMKTVRFMECLREQLPSGQYLMLITPFVAHADAIGRLEVSLQGADSSYRVLSASSSGTLIGLSALDECWEADGFVIAQRTDSAFASAVGWRIMNGLVKPMTAEQAGRDMPNGVMYADAPAFVL